MRDEPINLVPRFFLEEEDEVAKQCKALLHEAIFLATCNAIRTTEKHCKFHRGCHGLAIFVRNLQDPLEIIMLKSLASEGRALIGSYLNKIALQVALDMSHEATCLATPRKVENSFVALQVA